jgi:Ca-activated chloride channel family protein
VTLALKVLASAAADSASTRYARFQNREHVILLAFSDHVETPKRVNFDAQSLAISRAQVIEYADSLRARGGTAIYAALLQAQAIAANEQADDPDRFVSIVLFTDGENNRPPYPAEFRSSWLTGPAVRVFPILFGEGSPKDMSGLARFTGGRMFDGRQAALSQVFKEIRGYQ